MNENDPIDHEAIADMLADDDQDEKPEQLVFWSDLLTVRRSENSTSVLGISSDDGSRFGLSMSMHSAAFGDVFVDMQDKVFDDDWTHVRGLRLRSSIGGGNNPFITEAFQSIFHYFTQGMIEQPEIAEGNRLRINSNSDIQVTRNEDSETRLSVVGIQDDDREPVFIDIFVLQNGDVRLRMREQYEEDYEDEKAGEDRALAEMLFKTRKNGGQLPFIAAKLTQLAEKIAKAKQR